MILDKKQRYLQIALNSNLNEAKSIISKIPIDSRIIIEAGTPLLKHYGIKAITGIRSFWMQRVMGTQAMHNPAFRANPVFMEMIKAIEKKQVSKKNILLYIVADMKCMDRGAREVDIVARAGANAITALGHAPTETLDAFIEKCKANRLDSMIDMMNVDFPLSTLRKLKELPDVVILHRGVDEESFNREKEIPFHEIQRIKTEYDIMIAVAGGDTFEEARRAIFNDADIVVVWKSFYKSSNDTADLAEQFLKEIR